MRFALTLARHASSDEIKRLTQYVLDMRQYHAETNPAKPSYPTTITRSLVEEFSGQPFEYTEILPVFERYQPDTKAGEVAVQTRALADLCLLLFNTNEFMYVE